MSKLDLDKATSSFKKIMDSLSDEEIEALKEKYFPEDTTPKGWVDIEVALPFCKVGDFIEKGCSTYKVKDKNGNEGFSNVTDHHIWYYMAKEAGITHWFNE